MGLDMYAERTRAKLDKPVDFAVPEDREELHYWRKHPDLHGWMAQLYEGKGGEHTGGAFNCVPVALTEADLDSLESAVRKHKLPRTGGFFFGSSDQSRVREDLWFIAKARRAIEEGYTVYYTSWW